MIYNCVFVFHPDSPCPVLFCHLVLLQPHRFLVNVNTELIITIRFDVLVDRIHQYIHKIYTIFFHIYTDMYIHICLMCIDILFIYVYVYMLFEHNQQRFAFDPLHPQQDHLESYHKILILFKRVSCSLVHVYLSSDIQRDVSMSVDQASPR